MGISEQCDEAKRLYQNSLEPGLFQEAWHEAVDRSLVELNALLGASENLSDIEAALLESGKHVRPLRHLLAPPLSQDQFKLACPEWPKSSEKKGVPLTADKAAAVAGKIEEWLEPRFADAISKGEEIDLLGAAYLMARQEYETVRRNKLARRQEAEACAVLDALGFCRAEATFIDEPGAVAEREYLLTTRFATADGSSHEVDIAVGLSKKRILALECKVSNDTTNSVKRINDVMKKSEAWRRQWGKFVMTGALLQGVIKSTDISRMLDEGIAVFWSHDLNAFRDWVNARI